MLNITIANDGFYLKHHRLCGRGKIQALGELYFGVVFLQVSLHHHSFRGPLLSREQNSLWVWKNRAQRCCTVLAPNSLWLSLLLLAIPWVDPTQFLNCFSAATATFRSIPMRLKVEKCTQQNWGAGREYGCLLACPSGHRSVSGRGCPHSSPVETERKTILDPETTARKVPSPVTPQPGHCVRICVFFCCIWEAMCFLHGWGQLRACYTYFMLFCNRVYQKTGPDVVNIGNQDRWILWNAVCWVEVRLQSLVPVFPITYTAGRISSSSTCVLGCLCKAIQMPRARNNHLDHTKH